MAPPSDGEELSLGNDLGGTALFYEQHAWHYAEQTRLADLSTLRARLAGAACAGGRLLDVGCGGGRDLRAFRALGFDAIGLEPSLALARIAREYSGCEVRVGRVEQMSGQREFDAIWACASLLHLPRRALPEALLRMRVAAKPGAALFVSMQLGSGEFVAADGRFYTLYQPDALALAVGGGGFQLMEMWESGDSLGERPIRWINLLATAAGEPHL